MNYTYNYFISKGNPVSMNIIEATLNNVLLDLSKDYFQHLENSINYLDNHIVYEQKSEAWFDGKKNLLTGY